MGPRPPPFHLTPHPQSPLPSLRASPNSPGRPTPQILPTWEGLTLTRQPLSRAFPLRLHPKRLPIPSNTPQSPPVPFHGTHPMWALPGVRALQGHPAASPPSTSRPGTPALQGTVSHPAFLLEKHYRTSSTGLHSSLCPSGASSHSSLVSPHTALGTLFKAIPPPYTPRPPQSTS